MTFAPPALPMLLVLQLQIWDTAGQERFRTITRSYYRGAHAAVLTYDITRSQSFNSIPGWVNDVKRYAGKGAQTAMSLYVAGGKPSYVNSLLAHLCSLMRHMQELSSKDICM